MISTLLRQVRCSTALTWAQPSKIIRSGAIQQTLRAYAANASATAASTGDNAQGNAPLRNIGISAHIDSGKTTLTERVLFYTGRINIIHEVRGRDGVGAKMDSMELEREKGITIQSAATYTHWKGHNVNIIDTPGHVDFTVEVERALRVLDGAVLVLCAVSGVQSQTLTVDRQMKRYDVPCIVFINKLDRPGSDPQRVTEQLRSKLRRNAVLCQLPIGKEADLIGLVDLVVMKAVYFDGEFGEKLRYEDDIPTDMQDLVQEKRLELVAAVADHSDEVGEFFVMEEEPPTDVLKKAIRDMTIQHKLTPVMMGTALKNTGVQLMLDGVVDYLPAPSEVENFGLSIDNNEAKVALDSIDAKKPLVGLAFKLEEGKFGQLTYMRVYQGTLKKGDFMRNVNGDSRKKLKVPRLVRMHSDEMEDVDSVGPGEICAIFGLDCSSGDTFVNGKESIAMSSMFVPDPVLSLAITTEIVKDFDKCGKALAKFQREDPTFRVHHDNESNETIISGMGELHLEVYVERIKREYNVKVNTSKPKVAFKETIQQEVKFDYLHKKQSGGSGQFGRVVGEIIPLDDVNSPNEFENATVGLNIPPEYIPAIEKAWYEVCRKGYLTGSPVSGMKFILRDGAAHVVDSSEQAFNAATKGAIRQVYDNSVPWLLEPLMKVETSVPEEFQGNSISLLSKRKGLIKDSESNEGYTTIVCEVPLNNMFGFSNDLRSITQGKGEFSMEYSRLEKADGETRGQAVEDYTNKSKK